jgi:hypothetical protein
LLAVFFCAILPTHTLHDLFADHEDTEHGYCAGDLHSGVQIEKKHTHCQLLDISAPVYELSRLLSVEKAQVSFTSEIKTAFISFASARYYLNISGRGPPLIA